MAINLDTLREKVKPHDEVLLKEKEKVPTQDVLVGLLKEVEKKNLIKSKAGIPQKNEGQ